MRTLAFIDAANLFYGGLKSLGWKIDYQKLRLYLIRKYGAEELHYFGGVEIYDFEFDPLTTEAVPVWDLVRFLEVKLQTFRGSKQDFVELHKNYERVKFFRKLSEFGYDMILKPIKTYTKNGFLTKKADCDVDLAVKAIAEIDNYDRILLLSGDIDFLPLCKYLKSRNKEVFILSHPKSTSKELKRFAGRNFLNFNNLKNIICIKNEEVAQGGLF